MREVGYSNSRYESTETLSIDIGNFGHQVSAQSYHHTHETILQAASQVGFAYGNVLGLPEVRFEPYKRRPWNSERLTKIARPMPLSLDTMNTAKRWVYVFGATQDSADAFDGAVARLSDWRTYHFPEIADRMHILLPPGHSDTDVSLPADNPYKKTVYEYADTDNLNNKNVIVLNGQFAEHMNPSQKLKTIRALARRGIRPESMANDHLITP